MIFITYTNIRSFNGFNISAPVQNLILRDYCSNNNLQFSLPIEEYFFDDCYTELEGIIFDLKKKNILVMCSSEILPMNEDYLIYFIKKLTAKKCELHLILDKKVLKLKKEYNSFFNEKLLNKKIIEISSNSSKIIKKYLHGNSYNRS